MKRHPRFTRRCFLRTCGLGAGWLALQPLFPRALPLSALLARADEIDLPDHFFLMIRTFGGLDVTLGLDPQILPAGADEKDLFLEYRPEDILQASGLRLGPSAKPLAPYADRCVIINGVMMRR